MVRGWLRLGELDSWLGGGLRGSTELTGALLPTTDSSTSGELTG